MIRSLYRNSKGNSTVDLPTTHWRAALKDAGGLLWVDFSQASIETVEPLMAGQFGFHPLAIDDALRETHLPKLDDWGDYLYVCAHAVQFHADTLELELREVDVFLGRNFMVTHHRQPVESIERLWASLQKDQRRLERGADHLLYDLLDLIATEFMPTVDALDDAFDRLESAVFDRPSQQTLSTIFTIKRAVLRMRRILGPQREVLNRLARDEYALIDPADRVYFRDVYDHLVRLVDLNESLRDLATGALDTYLSVVANRTNAVMKVLTVVSVLFMPISFLAGFFGMNFLGLPFGDARLLLAAIAAMIVIPSAMLIWFRRSGWL